jgi:hypothetical protein
LDQQNVESSLTGSNWSRRVGQTGAFLGEVLRRLFQAFKEHSSTQLKRMSAMQAPQSVNGRLYDKFAHGMKDNMPARKCDPDMKASRRAEGMIPMLPH